MKSHSGGQGTNNAKVGLYRRPFTFAFRGGDGNIKVYNADILSYKKNGAEQTCDTVHISDNTTPGIAGDIANTVTNVRPSRIDGIPPKTPLTMPCQCCKLYHSPPMKARRRRTPPSKACGMKAARRGKSYRAFSAHGTSRRAPCTGMWYNTRANGVLPAGRRVLRRDP